MSIKSKKYTKATKLRRKQLNSFESSCQRMADPDLFDQTFNLQTATSKPGGYNFNAEQFRTNVVTALEKGKRINVVLGSLDLSSPLELRGSLKSIDFSNDHFWQLGDISSTRVTFNFSNLAAHTVSAKGLGWNSFDDCIIGTLVLGSDHLSYSVYLSGCLIGTIVFPESNGIANVIIRDCRVQCIVVPNAKTLPYVIRNDLELTGTIFETSHESELFSGAQSIRNLRINMEKLENTVAAAHLRRHELRAERPGDPAATRFVGWFYDIASEYGANTTRPLLWLLAIWAFSTAFVFLIDGGVIALPLETYVGWKENMIFDDFGGRLERSLWLSIQATFSPLAFLGYKQMVVAKFGLMKIFLIAQGLITDGIILMLIFGIRKRFKIN